MSERMGLALTATSATAVLMRGQNLAWSHAVAIANDESRRSAIQRLLASVPRRRGRVSLGVVVDRTYVQVRRLEGLPALDHVLQTRLVHQNPSAFFLKRDGGIVTSDVHRDDDVAWGAAFDHDIVDEIMVLAVELKLRLDGVAPTRAPFSHSQVEADDGGVEEARRATDVSRRTPLAWTPNAGGEPRRERVRLAFGAVTGLCAITVALLAPVLRASLDARRMTSEIVAARAIETETASLTAELRRVTTMLNQRTAFDATRGRMLRLIDQLARALPESTALVSIRADSVDVNLVAVSRHVTDVLPALTAVADSPSLRLVGSVSHDLSNEISLERAAFRFRQVRRGGGR